MTTHNPMNDSTASGQLSWQELEGLALLGIPISKEAQQIGLVFASEQRNIKKGKQVFLNTLSVIAVHECLQMFEFESYLESGDCWNKFKRLSLSSNDADLLIQDFGRIECFPILPKQESIEIEEHLLETRVGCVGVKFHERFNYVEMLGFKHFDQAFKSQQDNTRTFDVRDFQPFEDIFYHLPYISTNNISEILIKLIENEKKKIVDYNNWTRPSHLKLTKNDRYTYANAPNTGSKEIICKEILVSPSHRIILVMTVQSIEKNLQNIILQFSSRNLEEHEQQECQVIVSDNSQIIKRSTLKELQNDLIIIRQKTIGYQFQICVKSLISQKIEKFIV